MPSLEEELRAESERQAAAVAGNPSLLEQINRMVDSVRRAVAEGEPSVGQALEQHEAAVSELISGGLPEEEDTFEEEQNVPLSQPPKIGRAHV